MINQVLLAIFRHNGPEMFENKTNGLELGGTLTQWSWNALKALVSKGLWTYDPVMRPDGLERRTRWSCKGLFPMGNSSAAARASSLLGLEHL